jgi:hypothetical protein
MQAHRQSGRLVDPPPQILRDILHTHLLRLEYNPCRPYQAACQEGKPISSDVECLNRKCEIPLHFAGFVDRSVNGIHIRVKFSRGFIFLLGAQEMPNNVQVSRDDNAGL